MKRDDDLVVLIMTRGRIGISYSWEVIGPKTMPLCMVRRRYLLLVYTSQPLPLATFSSR